MKKLLLLVAVFILSVAEIYAQNVPSYVPTNGLVGYWPFNGNANDESGNGNNGTVNGASLTTDRNGNSNAAHSFSPNSYIEVLDVEQFDFALKNEMSMSFWMKATSANNSSDYVRIPISKQTGAGISQLGWNIFIEDTGNNLGMVVKNDLTGTQGYYSSSNISYLDDKWHFFSYTFNNGFVTIYIDHEIVNKSTTSSVIIGDNSGNLRFGQIDWASFYTFSGQLDDIAIYNRALTEQEITALYNGTNCSSETATSSNFNSVIYTTTAALNLNANPSGGTFSGNGVANNTFNPSKAKLGKNTVKYNFKNTTGCADSTNFVMILVDTLGNKCSTYDTLKIKMKLTTGIKAGQQTSMNIYPNPTSDKLIIETNDIQAISGYKYKILDIQGKEVYNALATSAKTEISLKSIGAKGMYILHIQDANNETIQSKQIVLE